MALSTPEVEALRFHLGYGNLDYGAYPYTPDGFKQLFEQVIGPNLTIGDETTATTAVTAGSTTTVTPVAMTGIVLMGRLVVDVGDAAETVVVRSVTATTFTAAFALAHPASGYPVCVDSGTTRLRGLLHQADKAWQALQSQDLGAVLGLKSVDKADVVWQDGSQSSVLVQRQKHYRAIVNLISSLVRVTPYGTPSRSGQLESY